METLSKITNYLLGCLLLSLVAIFLPSCGDGADLGGFGGGASLRNSGNDPGPQTGQGGSLAQFTIKGDYFYSIIDGQLKTFRIKDDLTLDFLTQEKLPFDAQTLFPFNDYLLIGAESGMYIYFTENGIPKYGSEFEHVRSCDPVVAQDHYAYVTLRTGGNCRGVDRLDVLDIKQIDNPKLIRSYNIASPHGLAVDGDLLFVCQGKNGVAVFNIEKRDKPVLMTTLHEVQAKDVILDKTRKVAMFMGYGALIQWDYENSSELKEISRYEL